MGKRGGKNRRKAEEEGGEGGEEKPSAAPGPTVEISQGGFADKRKYRLDDDTASYFKEIAKVLATSEEAKDPEQRAMLVSNALGEALGALLHATVSSFPRQGGDSHASATGSSLRGASSL